MTTPREAIRAALGRGAKLPLQDLALRTGLNTKQLSNALWNMKKAGEVARSAEGWTLAGEGSTPASSTKTRKSKRRAPKRQAARLAQPHSSAAAADFIAAITASKSLVLLRGDERITLTAEQSIEVADLVFANFEQ
jgi:hypothetical protein